MYISSQAFTEALKLWKKPSAVNDPFLRAILTFLRTKNATIFVYRSLKNSRGKPIFPIFCDNYDYDYETSSFKWSAGLSVQQEDIYL